MNTYERDLSASVELVFRPDARIRETERVTYCVGAPALRPHVLIQQVLDPGEVRTVPLRLDQGVYRVVAAQAKTDGDLVASVVGYESRVGVTVRDLSTSGRGDGIVVTARPSYVLAGELDITFRNDTDLEQTVRVEHAEGRGDRVAAVRAITHPTFRDFFGDELIGYGEHLNVSRITFLFLEAEERARVFAELGDVRACELFEELDRIFREQLLAEEGTDVAAPLGLSVAAFAHPQRAVQAGIGLLRAAQRRRGTAHGSVRVRLAVHEGRCLALTRGARLEYFGETLHRGVSLLEDSRPGSIAISSSVRLGPTRRQPHPRGVAGDLDHRVDPRPLPGAPRDARHAPGGREDDRVGASYGALKRAGLTRRWRGGSQATTRSTALPRRAPRRAGAPG